MIWKPPFSQTAADLRRGLQSHPAEDSFLSILRWWLPGMRVKRYAFIAFGGVMMMFLGVVHLALQSSLVPWFLETLR
jgi:hypothetical protein